MLPSGQIMSGSQAVGTGNRNQAFRTKKDMPLFCTLMEIPGKRLVCDQPAALRKGNPIIFRVRGNQGNTGGIQMIGLAQSLPYRTCFGGKGKKDPGSFRKAAGKQGKEKRMNILPLHGFQENIARFRQNPGIGSQIGFFCRLFLINQSIFTENISVIMTCLVIFQPCLLLVWGHSVTGVHKMKHFLAGTVKIKQLEQVIRKCVFYIMIILPIWQKGIYIIKKLVDKTKLQILFFGFIVGEKLPETEKKVPDGDEIDLGSVGFKKAQGIHAVFQVNNCFFNIGSGGGQAAEKTNIFPVIVKAFIYYSHITCFGSQKVCHRKIFKTDSFRKCQAFKKLSLDQFDPWVGGKNGHFIWLFGK